MSSSAQKPTFFQKLFGRSKSSSTPSSNDQCRPSSSPSNKKDRRHLSSSDADGAAGSKPADHPKPYHPQSELKVQTQPTPAATAAGRRSPTRLSPSAADGRPPSPRKPSPAAAPRQTSSTSSGGGRGARKKSGKRRKRAAAAAAAGPKPPTSIDTSRPLDFPATPEMILAYHQAKPFLNKNEEWLLIELNEYECLVDGLEIIRTIAKHSKFLEIEPDELWEEFFEYVDEIPSYDEVINFDSWQEFRDNKYPC